MWHEEQTDTNMHEDSDQDIDHYEANSILSRNPAAVAENGDHRVQDIQRLERALRVAGMA
jgi:hypothetical protein